MSTLEDGGVQIELLTVDKEGSFQQVAVMGLNKEDVLDLVKNRDFDVLVILGAGDLDNYVPQITKILEEK